MFEQLLSYLGGQQQGVPDLSQVGGNPMGGTLQPMDSMTNPMISVNGMAGSDAAKAAQYKKYMELMQQMQSMGMGGQGQGQQSQMPMAPAVQLQAGGGSFTRPYPTSRGGGLLGAQ